MDEGSTAERALAAANTALALAQVCFWQLIESGQINRDEALKTLQSSSERLQREGATAHLMSAAAIEAIIKRLKQPAN